MRSSELPSSEPSWILNFIFKCVPSCRLASRPNMGKQVNSLLGSFAELPQSSDIDDVVRILKFCSTACFPVIYSDSPKETAKSLQSCPTLCNPIDGSPSGSPVPGILQARTLEWVAISFSNAWKWKAKSQSEVAQLCPTLSKLMDCSLPGSSIHGIFQARVLEWVAIANILPFLLNYNKWGVYY